jgi:leucyl aminopeptidase
MGSADIKFSFSTELVVERRADIILVPVTTAPSSRRRGRPTKKEAAKPEAKKAGLVMTPVLSQLDEAMGGALRKIARDEQFTGAKGKLLSLRVGDNDKVAARKIILVGMGDPAKVSLRTVQTTFTRAFGAALELNNLSTVSVVVPTESANHTTAQWVSMVVDVAHGATYRTQESLKPIPALGRVVLLTEKLPSINLRKALNEAVVLAKAKNMVKDLVNKPANLKKPETLAVLAKELAKTHKSLKVKIQDDPKWIEKEMPCFFEVARGSVESDPPRFITLHYSPTAAGAKRRRNTKKIALVGKGVMFDTGGYQIKPGNSMVTMKGDMTGSACVLATMQAIAELAPNIEVSAYVAATPNKISAQAMICDSVVNTTCGKKVEIRHTDAEGRLTLIDAVAMACKDEPDAVLTIATLTGAASMAVGLSIAMMANDQPLRDAVEKAARWVGDPVQTLDITDEDFDNILSDMDGADLRNTNKGDGRGSQTAGAFVMCGAPEGTPVVHLDIAGADMTKDEKATAIGVKTLIQWVLNEAG